MSKWEFFEFDSGGKIIPLKSTYIKLTLGDALELAAKSKVPNPKFSKYFVKCSCILVDKKYGTFVATVSKVYRVLGGNLEYGLCQALHGEESLVAAISSKLGTSSLDPERYDVLVGFSSKFETGRVPTCCGNCRDIMRDYFPLNTMIFGGHQEGGKVIVARLRDLLKDEYGFRLDISELEVLKGDILLTIKKGLFLRNDIYLSSNIHPRRNYVAMIGGVNNFYGAHDVMCDYHPIYAIRDAVRQARRANSPYFNYVIVAVMDDDSDLPPDVMYKDRQHLLELNFQQECLLGVKLDPRVFLVSYKMKDNAPDIKMVWETTVKEWLPFPFSPANFGDEFVKYAKESFKAKIR